MRRRDFLKLLGGAAAGALLAHSARALSSDFGPWGFDLTGMNPTIPAGDDFFRHCNGAWLDRTEIAPDRQVASVDTVLIDRAEAQIREILERGEEGVEPAVRADAAKSHTMYASYMDEARIEALDARPLAPTLQMIRAADTRTAHASLMGAANETLCTSIFGLGVDIDAKAPSKYTVLMGQAGLGLPDRDYYLTAQFADKKKAYLAYIERMLRLIGWQQPQAAAAAILRFETAIAEVSWPLTDSRDSDKTYNPLTVAELSRRAPFAWTEFLRAAKLSSVSRIVVGELTAIPKIAALYARTPIETVKAWQAFRVADGAAPYLSKRFDNAHFEFRKKTLSGETELAARWKRAVRITDGALGEAVGRIYVARHFSPAAKDKVTDLVAEVRLAFKGRIERVTWMTPQTKAKALDKLARLNTKIGYPNKWRDYSGLEIRVDDVVGNALRSMVFEWQRRLKRLNAPVDRDEWDMTPQTVNAYYQPTLNEIVLPAAQLQAPYFDPDADPAVNYGGIGALIGHELTHGFDDDGRKYDAAGVLSDWWTEADVKEFNARAAVLARQYDKFEPYPGAHVNGELTLGENIADLGGTLIAFDAYRHSLAGSPAPVRDGFSGDQRFFLAFAQGYRAKRREDAVRQQLVSDPHSPEEYRVNGVVRNIDDWYDAFSVKAGEKLALANDERVRIW